MNNRRVLIADDNKANQLIAGKFLNQLGFETEFANNGEEAVDVISKMDVELVLMDLRMPVLSGLEACKLIRAKEDTYFENLPIIAVTSSFADDVKQQMEEFGLTDYIPKPINPASIKKIVSTYLPEGGSVESVSPSAVKLNCDCQEISFDCSRLHEITNGNIELIKDIIKTIVEILPAEIEIIEKATVQKDYTVVRRSAHKIKPNYEYVGLVDLAEIAERIEESAGKISISTLNDLIANLSAKTKEVVPFLRKCELKQVH